LDFKFEQKKISNSINTFGEKPHQKCLLNNIGKRKRCNNFEDCSLCQKLLEIFLVTLLYGIFNYGIKIPMPVERGGGGRQKVLRGCPGLG